MLTKRLSGFKAPILVALTLMPPIVATAAPANKVSFKLETAVIKLVQDPKAPVLPQLTWAHTDPIPTRIRPATVTSKPPLQKPRPPGSKEVVALLEGELSLPPTWGLLLAGRKVGLRPKGTGSTFKVALPLTGKITPVTVHIVGQKGQVQQTRIFLVATAPKPRSNWVFQISAGPTYVTYSETDFGELTQIQMTGKFAFQYYFVPGVFDIGANTFFTIAPLSAQTLPAVNDGAKAWFLGVNGRLGYTLPFVKKPFSLRLLGGAYWTNLYGIHPNPERGFGFGNLVGLQIFPNLAYSFGTQSVYLYAKFSPVFDSNGALNFTDTREIAGGTGWSYRFQSGNAFSISFDFAHIALKILGIEETTNEEYEIFMDGKSYSLSVGFTF